MKNLKHGGPRQCGIGDKTEKERLLLLKRAAIDALHV